MTSDVTVSSFIICLDVVHNSFESQAFFDYLKNNHKKSVIFINAPDFVDSNGRSSRSSSSLSDSHGSHSRISYKSLSKSIKNKINTELTKLIDQKRKTIAQNEKKAQQLAKANRPVSSTSAHSKMSIDSQSPPPFDGQTEVVFIIQGFPYTESQFKALCSYLDFGAFISIVRQSQTDDTASTHSTSVSSKKSNEKSVRSPASKKVNIHGSETDSALNPGVVPPMRWKTLIPNASPSIPFSQIDAPPTIEECWNSLELEIARIIRCRKEFEERFNEHKFVILPKPSETAPDLSIYEKYITQHRDEDLINAMMTQIEKNMKKTEETVEPQKNEDIYARIFKEINDKIMRFKVAKDPEETIEPFFDRPIKPKDAFDILYQLSKWKLNDDNAPVNKAVLDFYANYDHFNAVAGHQYEVMLAQANKRLSLAFPISFFEWTKFLYAYEHADIRKTIVDVFKKNYVFDTVLEETAGIMWVLALPPVARTIGQAIRRLYMPPAFDGISEWLVKIFENEKFQNQNNEVVKSRVQISPAQVLKNGGDIESLIPTIFQRTEKKEDPIYKVKMDLAKCADLISPFFFTNGIQADIIRNIVNDRMTFGYIARFPNGLEISSTYDTVNIDVHQICKLIFGFSTDFNSLTILKNDNPGISIFYQNGQLSLRSDQSFVITENGHLVFEHKGNKVVLESNGRIRKYNDKGWTFSEPDGRLFKETEEGIVPLNNPHNKLTDMRTGISRVVRDDDICYMIYSDGERVIKMSEHFIIRQTKDSVVYEFPNLPFVTFRDDSFTFMFDDACFVLRPSDISISKDTTTTINCDYKEIKVESYESEISLTYGVFQIKVDDTVLFADDKGTQRIGPLLPPNAPPKRKVEFVETKWGKINQTKETLIEANHLELLSVFRPRFFAIRSDFSATEYIHREGFIPGNRVQKEKVVDDVYDVVTLHQKGEKPIVYLKQKVLEKQPRSVLLKTLQIPKQSRQRARPRKGQPLEDPEEIKRAARDSNEKHLEFWENVRKIQERTCNELETEYQDEIRPKPIPPPEIIEPAIFTPDPRLLEMMHMKYAPTNVSLENNNGVDCDIINYWESPEAEFAFPLKNPPVLPRPVSPHNKLFDMPPSEEEKLRRKGYDEPPELPEEEYDFSLTSQAREKRREKERETARMINTARAATRSNYQNSLQVISDLKPPSKDVSDVIKPVPPSTKPKSRTSTNNINEVSPSPRRFSSRIYSTEVSRPQTAHSNVSNKNEKFKKKVEFGVVKRGMIVSASLDIQNTGTRPLHYSVTRPDNKDVVMNTIPGVIMPGLKLAIKLTLNAINVGKIETSFQFKSPLGDMTIPVTAYVVDRNSESDFEEEEAEDVDI